MMRSRWRGGGVVSEGASCHALHRPDVHAQKATLGMHIRQSTQGAQGTTGHTLTSTCLRYRAGNTEFLAVMTVPFHEKMNAPPYFAFS